MGQEVLVKGDILSISKEEADELLPITFLRNMIKIM